MEPEAVGIVIFLLLLIVGAIICVLQRGSEEAPDMPIEGCADLFGRPYEALDYPERDIIFFEPNGPGYDL